jgi:GTP-binding protein Era
MTEQDIDTFDIEEAPPGHRSGFVAVIGRPNVGKSTLVNAYVGQKIAIVSPKPQTTRERLLGILTRTDAQVIFMDTPGIHTPKHKLGEVMVETARRTIPDADVILFLVDVSVLPTEEDVQIAELLKKAEHGPVILALNKSDLLAPADVVLFTESYIGLVEPADAALWMLVSATRGDNRDKLLDLIIAHLPEGPRYYPPDEVTDQQERDIAAELIREQALALLRDEVPHSVAVQVEEFKERSSGLVYISATICVEKDSQKGILIGKDGEMLRKIGAAARREIEALLETRVYLELWVKVRKNWRKREVEVRRLGYTLPD